MEALEGDSLIVRFEAEEDPAPPPALRLALALPRPKVLSRVLRAAASFGVREIDLINAWKVERSYFDSPRLAPERLDADLRAGCEQGAHTWLPSVRVHRRFLAWLEDLPPPPREEARLFAQIGARPLLPAVAGEAAAWLIAVGPEGGWVEAEEASLLEVGFAGFRLARSILAVPEAVTATLAQMELLPAYRAIRDP